MRPLRTTCLVALAPCLFACTAKVEPSSTPPPAPSAAPAPSSQERTVLTGRYESTNGPFTQITFYDDSHYVATKRPSDGRDVASYTHGTYTIDSSAMTLSLKDDLTGKVLSGPIKITATDKAPPGFSNGTKTQSLSPDDLVGGVGSLLVGVVSLLVGAFSWLGDFLGMNGFGMNGFNSGNFDCGGYGSMGPDGSYYSTIGMPNNPMLQLSTSRAFDGTGMLSIGSFAPAPVYNGYTRFPGGWSSMDSDMLAGRPGNIYYDLPGTGPYMSHCNPY